MILTIIKNKTWVLFFVAILGLATSKPNKQYTTVEFIAKGCCGQCKDRIENALDKKGIRFAEWDKNTRLVRITFKSDMYDLPALHSIIAEAGHDTEVMTAPDSVYNTLPQCCKYRGGGKCTH